MPKPLFNREDPDLYEAAAKHNLPYAVAGPYQTPLSIQEEMEFRGWVKKNGVPFDPDASVVDYDMRGYWQAMKTGKAEKWRGKGTHFPDTYKTPYDTTFSGESKYAKPHTPFVWRGNNLIDQSTGQLIFAPPTGAYPLAK